MYHKKNKQKNMIFSHLICAKISDGTLYLHCKVNTTRLIKSERPIDTAGE